MSAFAAAEDDQRKGRSSPNSALDDMPRQSLTVGKAMMAASQVFYVVGSFIAGEARREKPVGRDDYFLSVLSLVLLILLREL